MHRKYESIIIAIFIMFALLLWNADVAFSAEFKFDHKIFRRWRVTNYNNSLRFDIKKDSKTFKKYLRITLKQSVASPLESSKKIDTAFKLTSPTVKVMPDRVYYLKVKKRSTFDIPKTKVNRKSNHITWYNMYDEEIGKTNFHFIGKKGESPSFFVERGLLALPEAEKVRIAVGFDTPDFSEKDFLDIYEVKFEEYENRPFDFEDDRDSGWETTFNHKNHLVMGISKGGVNRSKYCYRVERKTAGKANTAFKLASPYIPIEPYSYHTLSFEARHNYDFSRVTKGYCQILWYDAKRNLIGKSNMGSLLKPHLEWFPWMKAFFKSPKSGSLARVEFGNDWPDFKYGDFWEVDDVLLRPQ